MEIKEAVSVCERDKVPGPNSFSMAIFQDCWVVVERFSGSFEEFHKKGIVNFCRTAPFICLIHKKENSMKSMILDL